ncbi:unnamed protein product (macronuclear) [Paramecium tetraurelia]|uniref:CDT1 Geminin-binding domain-containing protein n=1 Tax=Paramecium tetraurelia TaxID=5888 RepID=A0E4I0_PARTE|nr:uncharacterized protein GSPATT00023372001 [Paramecium tetraurelia]CAK90197.1 unnamed protein product [Paramecium tetraurelia]|eukprot:XP_001457594.1 hypothetical protein (macronuclear) [Paramecium tetraurelia strain d4-2]
MSDFLFICDSIQLTIKKVKLDLFNSFEDETMSAIIKKNETSFIPFLSLRQKFGIHQKGGFYPLPKKYACLLDLCKRIETNVLRNQCQIYFSVQNNFTEIIQVLQLLNLNPNLYKIKVNSEGIVIQHPFLNISNKNDNKNAIKSQQEYKQMSEIIEKRMTILRDILDYQVKIKHKEHLSIINCEDFEQFGSQFKIYHNDFDLNDSPDIKPIKLTRQIFSKELIQFHLDFLNHLIEHYDKRGVSFMYYDNIVTILSVHFNKVKSEIEKTLKNIINLLPDKMNILMDHINKQRWIVQLDRSSLQQLNKQIILNQFLFY